MNRDNTEGEDDVDELPFEDMYDEPTAIPVNPLDLLYQEQEKQWEPIEFEDITVEGETRKALADAATQFHFIYLSQLITLGDITKNAANLNVKRLASFLTSSRIRDVDAWGRYLTALKMRTTVSSSVRTYCNKLYSDDNRLSRMIGIILTDVFRQAVGTNTIDFPDVTFERLMERDIEEGDKNVRLTRSYLQRINRELTEEQREDVVMQMDRYAVLIEDILDEKARSFSQLGTDVETIRDHIGTEIDEFHSVIKEG